MNIKDKETGVDSEQLKLFKEGNRRCSKCKKVKPLKDFFNLNSVKIFKKQYGCKSCTYVYAAKAKKKVATTTLEQARSSEWYKNYLAKKALLPKNKQGNRSNQAINKDNKLFSYIRKNSYLMFK